MCSELLLPSDNVPILSMDELFLSAPNSQATNQLLAIIVTLAFAIVGGLFTGSLMFIYYLPSS